MADFTSGFWSWYITVLTILSIFACFVLIWWMGGKSGDGSKDVDDTGHVWDEDLRELNNPLPKWWLNMFYITLVFGIGYLALWPGLGTFQGLLGWSSAESYNEEIKVADEKYGPLFQGFLAKELADVAEDPAAQKMGERLFASYCATCHGSDARGARGFPNLRDGDWQWGGDANSIKVSIMSGRTGAMPGWEGPLGGETGVADMTQYVLQLSERAHDAEAAARGAEKYSMFCVACHGADGKGNQALGAPNLTNGIWLYGGSREQIAHTLRAGRNGQMPAFEETLSEDKIHILTAYVYGLTQ